MVPWWEVMDRVRSWPCLETRAELNTVASGVNSNLNSGADGMGKIWDETVLTALWKSWNISMMVSWLVLGDGVGGLLGGTNAAGVLEAKARC